MSDGLGLLALIIVFIIGRVSGREAERDLQKRINAEIARREQKN